MIPVELAPEVVATVRRMSHRGEQPPRCHDGVMQSAIAGSVRRLVDDDLSGSVRPWDLPALQRRAADLGDVSGARVSDELRAVRQAAADFRNRCNVEMPNMPMG